MTGFWTRTLIGMLAALASACSQSRVGERVSIDTIASIEPGMTYSEVVRRIGVPLKMETELPKHRDVEKGVWIQGDMVPSSSPEGTHVELTYSEPGGLMAGYPMVWIHLRNGNVSEVYVKWYPPFLGPDEGIYGYSTDQPRWQNSVALRAALPRRPQPIR